MYQNVDRSTALIAKAAPEDGFIRQKSLLLDHVPFSAATLWRLVNAGKFPKPVKVTDQITAWRVSDIKAWSKNPSGYAASATEGSK